MSRVRMCVHYLQKVRLRGFDMGINGKTRLSLLS